MHQFLERAQCLDAPGAIVVLLRHGERRMAENAGDDPVVLGIIDGDRGRSYVPERVRAERLAELAGGCPRICRTVS